MGDGTPCRAGAVRRGRAAWLTVALALAGCAVEPVAVREPLVEPEAAGQAPADGVAALQVDDQVPAAPFGDALIGEGRTELIENFGEPHFVWAQADAEMWRWDARGCRVFVYLYPDGVRHVDVHVDDPGESKGEHCLCGLESGCD